MKRRISLVLAAAIILVLAAATALAVTALRGLGFVGREMDGSVYSLSLIHILTSSQQGESIPGIAHAVVLESPKL